MAQLIVNEQSYSPAEFIAQFSNDRDNEKKGIAQWISLWLDKAPILEVQTSGSTGQAKTLSLPRSAFEKSATMTKDFFNLETGSVALLCLPIIYVAAKMMVIRALFNDWTLIIIPAKTNLQIPANHTIDLAAMTPQQVAGSFDSLSSIRQLIIGGTALPPNLESRLQTIPTWCYETYGMTETLTHVALRQVNLAGRQSHFHPLPTIILKVNGDKQLVINAPHIQDEPMITNDIADLDENGSFKILGRADNVINSGGIKLFPEAIERKIAHLVQSPFYITSKPDEHFGEKAVLVIESLSWTSKEHAQLLLKAERVLDKLENPKEIVFVDSFEHTPSGKIKRQKF